MPPDIPWAQRPFIQKVEGIILLLAIASVFRFLIWIFIG